MNKMLPRPWYELAEACGGVPGLALLVGVSNTTIYRWAHGEAVVRTPARKVVEAIAKERGCVSPFGGT